MQISTSLRQLHLNGSGVPTEGTLVFDLADNEGAVGSAESEGVGEDDVERHVDSLARYVERGSVLVGLVEVYVGSHKVVLQIGRAHV